MEWRRFVTYLWNDPRITGLLVKNTDDDVVGFPVSAKQLSAAYHCHC